MVLYKWSTHQLKVCLDYYGLNVEQFNIIDIFMEYKPSTGQLVEPRDQTLYGEAALSSYAPPKKLMWNK